MVERSVQFAAALVVALAARTALADDPPKATPPPPAAPGAPAGTGPVFTDGTFTVTAPAGWSMEKDKGAIPTWSHLASFVDPASKTVAVVSGRGALAFTLTKLRDEVTAFYARDPSWHVQFILDIPVGGPRSLPGVIVDAIQTKPADPLPPGSPPPATPPPATLLRSNDAYFLGGGSEYRVFVQAKSALWPRLQPSVDAMIKNALVKATAGVSAPRGEGAYLDSVAGFQCRFPTGYSVQIPGRESFVVQFAPASDGPVIGVYRYDSDHDLDAEVKTLVDYYQGEEVGGEAASGSGEVSGRTAAFVSAKGTLAGKAQVWNVAVVKRGNQTFRLRVAAPAEQAEKAKQVFDAFVKSFVLTSA
jgi:hypothetical protein